MVIQENETSQNNSSKTLIYPNLFLNPKGFLRSFSTLILRQVTDNSLRDKEVDILEKIPILLQEKTIHYLDIWEGMDLWNENQKCDPHELG